MLFSRDNDSDNVARSTSELTELVPDDAKYHQLDFFTNAVTIVLREIKQERIELAREYIENKKLEDDLPSAPPEQEPSEIANASKESERRSARTQKKPSLKKAKKNHATPYGR